MLYLNIGEPDFTAAPLVAEAAQRCIRDGQTQYTAANGLPALRENYAAHLAGFYGAPIAAAEVGITSGCNQAFCLALMSIAKAGDQVILPRPHYFNHDMWMRMQGVEPV